MRTENSIRNIIVSCISYGILFVGSFVTRKIFAKALGLEYVGIDGAFTSIISALAIVEMGLGVGIVYKLYKPIACKDWAQVSSILCFLRKSYVIISLTVLGLGAAIAYFVVQPIKEDFSKTWLIQIFILYVLDVVASYLFSHKRSMFIADQKNYVNNLIHIFAQVLMFISQIAVLKVFCSFEAYMICRIASRLVENIWISYRFDKNYGFIDLKKKSDLPDIEKKDLFRNIKAMLLHKISAFGATGLSSLIIVYGVGLKETGVYNNYMLIVTAVMTITNEIFNSIVASFGNLLNTSAAKERVYNNFNALYFFNFLIYSFGISAFVCVITPFIELWTGVGTAFDITTVLFIAAYLYIYGIRQSLTMAKVSAGIYDPDKYISLVGSLITLVCSYLLVKPMGVSGVMLGNIIGIFLIPYVVQPYLVYSMVFHKSSKPYHYKFAFYTFLTAIYLGISYFICNNLAFIQNFKEGLSGFLIGFHVDSQSAVLIACVSINFIVCLIIPNALNILIFFRSKEFKKLASSAKSVLVRH